MLSQKCRTKRQPICYVEMNDSLGFAEDSLTILIHLLALQHVTNLEANLRGSADPK